jgi:hypothetical protein
LILKHGVHVRIERSLEEYEERDKKRLKALEANKKIIENKDRLIEELKKQLTARSL